MVDAQFADDVPASLGSISVRVSVLPPKKSNDGALDASDTPADLAAGELMDEAGSFPVSSYLEVSRGGKRCCVFLVNGQRQDFLDNTFIVHELGFKYLRHRMMITVDCDQLSPEAVARLMQGSRQGFYKGEVWRIIIQRLTASLKNDPDLRRLEEEAEEQVLRLQAGDEKVRHTLDQLISAHHEAAPHLIDGSGTRGAGTMLESVGVGALAASEAVTAAHPNDGLRADYPLLKWSPQGPVRLAPNEGKEVLLACMPASDWPARASLAIQVDPAIPELVVKHVVTSDGATATLTFSEPEGFDLDLYPIRARVNATALFNGIKHPRSTDLDVVIRPVVPAPDPVLLDEPTLLRVITKEPVKVRVGDNDTHVALRWDGRDHLLSGDDATWALSGRLTSGGLPPKSMSFSEPRRGRFTLLVSPDDQWKLGDWLEFEVKARGAGRELVATFIAEVAAPPTKPERPEQTPRLVTRAIASGASRRPPYNLVYIERKDYAVTECWGAFTWTDADSGCFLPPTERAPLTLVINTSMDTLEAYKRSLATLRTESELERRINKYTSHVAFHLYQMFLATVDRRDEDGDKADFARRDEIRRVATTLLKLMEVSR